MLNQGQIPTPEMVLGPILAWGKLVMVVASVIALALLGRSRFNDFINAVKALSEDVAEIRTDLRDGIDAIREELGDHRTQLAVIRDRMKRGRTSGGDMTFGDEA